MIRKFLLLLLALPLFAVQPKLLYLSSEKLPDNIYVGQTLSLDITALVVEKEFSEISTTVGEMSGLTLLNSNFTWRKVDQDRYRLSLYFQIKEREVMLPTLDVFLMRHGEAIDTASLNSIAKRALNVAKNPQFSQVIADKLEVLTHKVERFDDEQNILIMEMQADSSNLKEFALSDSDILSQGIDWSQTRLPTTKILYYATIPPTKESVSFNYFMPSSGDFKRIDLMLDLSSIGQKISTHSDINPNKKDIPWMNIFLLTITALSLVFLFIKTHKWIILVVVAINAAIIFWVVVKEDVVTIQTNAEVRLLPTSTSTLFYKTDRPIEAKLLKTTDDYYKVLLPDEKIGWVKKTEATK